MSGFFRRVLSRLSPAPPIPSPARVADAVGDHLRAVVAAGTRAKSDNSRTYEARVRTMMDEFFLEMRDTDARPRS